MRLRATIPPGFLTDDERALVSDHDLGWDGTTTGARVELDAEAFAAHLRRLLNAKLQTARAFGDEEKRQGASEEPRFRNLAALALWLEAQIARGTGDIELAEFVSPIEEPPRLRTVVLSAPGLPAVHWSPYLTTARCPVCGTESSARELREVEYDLFFCGAYVLTCPRDHRLFVVRRETYQLGG